MSAAILGPDGWTPSPSGCAITPQGVPAIGRGEVWMAHPIVQCLGWRFNVARGFADVTIGIDQANILADAE
uniref:Uncharacterized protein n=1 Tax=Magallana gigas TaxID=29159 RepID=K1R9D5_MAGGI